MVSVPPDKVQGSSVIPLTNASSRNKDEGLGVAATSVDDSSEAVGVGASDTGSPAVFSLQADMRKIMTIKPKKDGLILESLQ